MQCFNSSLFPIRSTQHNLANRISLFENHILPNLDWQNVIPANGRRIQWMNYTVGSFIIGVKNAFGHVGSVVLGTFPHVLLSKDPCLITHSCSVGMLWILRSHQPILMQMHRWRINMKQQQSAPHPKNKCKLWQLRKPEKNPVNVAWLPKLQDLQLNKWNSIRYHF